MEFLGKWKINSIMMYDANYTCVYVTPEKYVELIPSYIDSADEAAVAKEKLQRRMNMDTIISIEDNNRINYLVPDTEEYRALIGETDANKVADGYIIVDSIEWKLVEGELYYDTQLGMMANPFKKAFDEKGRLNINDTEYVRI